MVGAVMWLRRLRKLRECSSRCNMRAPGLFAVNGRMCTHFVHPEGYVEPLAAVRCCHLLHDLVGLVPEGNWR